MPLPHLRLLYLDTDPEAVHAAGQAQGRRRPCPAGTVLLARLNRASHYLKPREGRPRIETWLNTNMLYRIPRNQVTGGVRALGRLAFIDNYRTIAHRLRADLEACTDPARPGGRLPADRAEAAHQPAARLCRHQPGRRHRQRHVHRPGLRGSGICSSRLGYASRSVVGLFLLPAVTRQPGPDTGPGQRLCRPDRAEPLLRAGDGVLRPLR